MRRRDLELLALHLVLFAAGGLLLATGGSLATRAWAFAAAYHISLPLYARYRGDGELFDLWLALLPLSALQILPDVFLAFELRTIEFPAGLSGGPVPAFMAPLWTPPLLLACWAGIRTIEASSVDRGYLAAAAAGALLFASAELTLPFAGVWTALDVATVGGMALYILPAEIALCVATLFMVRHTADAGWLRRVAASAAVSVFYLGAAATSYLAVERLLLGS